MKYLTEALTLIPHFALDPNAFRTSKRRSRLPRREMLHYWLESLAEAGVDDLRPLQPDHWVVPVRDIHQPPVLRHLYTIIHQPHVRAPHSASGILHHIDGGLSLLHNGVVIAASMCCADLSNIEDWRSAAAYRGAAWHMLWNGHPWMYVHCEADHLLLSDLCESAPATLDAARYAVPLALLAEAVEQAERELTEFVECLDAYIQASENLG